MSPTLRKGWAIVVPARWRRAKPGQMMMLVGICFTRSDAIRQFVGGWDTKRFPAYGKWSHWYKKGYRAVRVQVVMP